LLTTCGAARARPVKIMSPAAAASAFRREIRPIAADICELVKWDVVVEVGETVGLGWRKRALGFSSRATRGIPGVIGWRGHRGAFPRCSACRAGLPWKQVMLRKSEVSLQLVS
jgi:hypothetical protein